MKNKIFSTLALGAILGGVGFLSSCGSDDASFAVPTITLSETSTSAFPGEEISVTISVTTDAEFESLVVTKLLDGSAQGTETFTELPADEFTYSYKLLEADAEEILTFNFTLTDAAGNTSEVEWVITVGLSLNQILVKNNWRLSDEVRAKTNESDIEEHYQDDVYQFNEDGTYQKSNGPLEDGFNDDVTIYCFWEITEDLDTLFMTKTDTWNSVTIVDTIAISTQTEAEIKGGITYYGLDAFNTGNEETPYESVEVYEKQFVMVAKTSAFDPYGAGVDDDAGPAGECNADWKN